MPIVAVELPHAGVVGLPLVSSIVPNLLIGGSMNGIALPETIQHLVSLCGVTAYEIGHPIRSVTLVWLYDDPEREVPGFIEPLARWVAGCIEDHPTLVHCQAGFNRSALVAARALMLRGRTADEAIALIRRQRSEHCLFNWRFEAWLRSR